MRRRPILCPRLREEPSSPRFHYFISEEEEEAAIKNLTATRYLDVCVYEFAIPEFQRHGMRGDAYELIDEGWGKFTPCKGSASFSIFLEKMSGNPKFGIL